MDLRHGEFLLEQCAGGTCCVCSKKIPPGRAVQLSSYTSRIRHVECMPKTDGRNVGILRRGKVRKAKPD